MRIWCLVILLLFSVHSYAESLKQVSDWRLQSPFTQGLIMSLSFGFAGQTPDTLPSATDSSVLAYYPLVAEHLVRHSHIAFSLGFSTGLGLYVYFGYLLFRYRRICRYARYGESHT